MTLPRNSPAWRAAGPYLPTNSSKAGLFEETRQFLRVFDELRDVEAARLTLLDGGLLQRSRFTRMTILQFIKRRLFGWQPPAWVVEDLITFARDPGPDALQAALLLHVCRQDTLLYDLVQKVIAPLLAGEPLDRWIGDGVLPPGGAEDLLAAERAWRVDINDGVRVNVAPLQLEGLLAAEVLKSADARKALADRARWRSDERRWVREGVLPRCGWMDEDVPESPRWTERAPEREAERARLEEKRRAVMERLGHSDEISANGADG